MQRLRWVHITHAQRNSIYRLAGTEVLVDYIEFRDMQTKVTRIIDHSILSKHKVENKIEIQMDNATPSH